MPGIYGRKKEVSEKEGKGGGIGLPTSSHSSQLKFERRWMAEFEMSERGIREEM
jgi:hypothetical protein